MFFGSPSSGYFTLTSLFIPFLIHKFSGLYPSLSYGASQSSCDIFIYDLFLCYFSLFFIMDSKFNWVPILMFLVASPFLDIEKLCLPWPFPKYSDPKSGCLITLLLSLVMVHYRGQRKWDHLLLCLHILFVILVNHLFVVSLNSLVGFHILILLFLHYLGLPLILCDFSSSFSWCSWGIIVITSSSYALVIDLLSTDDEFDFFITTFSFLIMNQFPSSDWGLEVSWYIALVSIYIVWFF